MARRQPADQKGCRPSEDTLDRQKKGGATSRKEDNEGGKISHSGGIWGKGGSLNLPWVKGEVNDTEGQKGRRGRQENMGAEPPFLLRTKTLSRVSAKRE